MNEPPAELVSALHTLEVRIPGLPDQCHCNLVANVAMDALAPALAAAKREARQEAIEALRDEGAFARWMGRSRLARWRRARASRFSPAIVAADYLTAISEEGTDAR